MVWEQVGHGPKTTAWIVGNGLLILPQIVLPQCQIQLLKVAERHFFV